MTTNNRETSKKAKRTEEKITQLEKLADRLERMRVGDYVTNLNKTSRLIWLSLMSGVARGVGLTLGATLVIAIIFKIISALISLNVPYLSEMMKDAQEMLQARYQVVHEQQAHKNN